MSHPKEKTLIAHCIAAALFSLVMSTVLTMANGQQALSFFKNLAVWFPMSYALSAAGVFFYGLCTKKYTFDVQKEIVSMSGLSFIPAFFLFSENGLVYPWIIAEVEKLTWYAPVVLACALTLFMFALHVSTNACVTELLGQCNHPTVSVMTLGLGIAVPVISQIEKFNGTILLAASGGIILYTVLVYVIFSGTPMPVTGD